MPVRSLNTAAHRRFTTTIRVNYHDALSKWTRSAIYAHLYGGPMTIKSLFVALFALGLYAAPAVAQVEELDPFDPNVEQILNQFDSEYEKATGLPSHFDGDFQSLFNPIASQGCVRESCQIWAQVVKSRQELYLYVNGVHTETWKVSSGIPGRGTPNFDKHPDGRIYQFYMSRKFPGGDYMGLGNMPYAVFISGGFAIHGTPASNWGKLGRVASHGCIRIHPENAARFNAMVRAAGVRNTWITVQQ